MALSDTQKRQMTSALELAGRETTDEHTALSAMRQVRRLLDTAGKSFTDLTLAGAAVVTSSGPKLSYAQSKNQLSTLQAENDRLTKELAAANRKIAGYEKVEEKVPASRPDGSMKWRAFAIEAERRFTNSKFKSAFASHAGVEVAEIAKWQNLGYVPETAVVALRTFSKQHSEHIHWTNAKIDEAEALIDAGKADREVSETLSERWGRTVSKGSAKKARQIVWSKRRTIELFKAGTTDPAKISAIIRTEHAEGQGGASPKRIAEFIAAYC